MSGITFVLYFASLCIPRLVVGAEGDEEDRRLEWYTEYIPEPLRTHTGMYDSPDKSYKIYHNLWYHNSQYYAIVADPANTTVADAMSANQLLVYLPTVDAERFLNNVEAVWVPGTTLALDLVFPAFPTNLGHWAEILLPMLSALQDARWRDHVQHPEERDMVIPDRILLVNTFEGDILDWLDEMLAVALGLDSPTQLPQFIDSGDVGDLDKAKWLGFENYMLVTDRYTLDRKPNKPHSAADVVAQATSETKDQSISDPVSSPTITSCSSFDPADWPFALRTPEAADAFRSSAYRAARLPLPSEEAGAPIPKQITIVTAASGEVVSNKDDLVGALWQVAKDNGWRVRQFTATPEAPFASHVTTMAHTGVLVARHGATLASSFLLPSGAAVYELLPYNWEWRNLNQIYRNMTRSTGRLHHFAWRATDPKWAVYAEPQDQSRYAHFRASECTSRTCMTVHAKAGLRVDVDAIKEDFQWLLPMLTSADDCPDVFCKVKKNCRQWPPAD